MKHLLALLFFFGALLSGFAQMPTTMNYQGVARDASGNPIASQAITVRFTIHQGSPTGTVVYDEDQYQVINTDDKGHFSTTIGDGFVLSGTYSTIDWSAGPYFLEVGLDPTGALGYTSTGTQQLLTVPYALYAKTAETVLNGGGGEWTANGNDISNSNSGKVGIGTTTPINKFEVKGSVLFEQDGLKRFYMPNWSSFGNNKIIAGVMDGDGFNAPLLRFGAPNSTFTDVGVDATGNFLVEPNGNTRFSILQNGNVGIGTTTPTTKLNIRGGTDASLSNGSGYLLNGSESGLNMVMDNNEIQVRNAGVASTMYLQADGGEFRIGNASASRMIVLDTGFVGIGTSSPSSQLEVYGDSKSIEISNTSETDAGIIFNDAQATTTQFAEIKFNSGTNDLIFTQDGTPAITIEPNGEVGIGTSNPQSALAVNGTITSKEIEVTLSGFPDYVFEDDYYLMTLEEVEAYIEEHGHLPNVPSAEVIEEEGVGLGELNKILMEKVEELTLHLIEKDKTLNQLADRLQVLENGAAQNAK